MPVLGALLVVLFEWIGSFVVKYLGQKAGFWVICVGTILASYLALRVAIGGIVAGLIGAAPAMVGTMLTWFVPPQFQAIIAARVAAQVAIAMYQWQLNLRHAMVAGA